jgi:spore germination protein KB
MFLFIFGSVPVEEIYYPSRQDVWFTIIMAAVPAFLMALIYSRTMSLNPGCSLFEILRNCFGKIAGNIITVAYVLFFVYTCGSTVRMLCVFVFENALPHTPAYVIAIPACLLAAWMGSLDMYKLSRGIVISAFILLFAFFLTVPNTLPATNFNNMFPMLQSKKEYMLHDAIYFYTIPLSQTVVFMCLLDKTEDTKARRSSFIFGMLMGVSFLILVLLRSVMIFDSESMGTLPFRIYNAVTALHSRGIAQRIELVIAGIFLMSTIGKLAIIFHSAARGGAAVFPKLKPKHIIFVLAAAAFIVSLFIFESEYEAFNAYYMDNLVPLPFQTVIPILLWIISEIKRLVQKHREKKNGGNANIGTVSEQPAN